MAIRRSAFLAAVAAGLVAALGLADVAGGQSIRPGYVPPPLTLLQLMRANVEIPADGIWAVSGNEKLSDEEWLLAEQDTTNLIASATFIAVGGTGPKDKGWVANADYQTWAKDVQDTGFKLMAAVKAKDIMKFGAAADHLNEVCVNCHTKYRPENPSDGIARFPFYPVRVIKK